MPADSNGHATAERGALTVVHSIPGRLRLRLPAAARSEGVAQELAALPGVTSSTFAPRTGSLLVHYDPAVITPDRIAGSAAEHAAVDMAEVSDVPTREPSSGGGRTLASAVTAAFADANARVARVTGGVVDLGGLVPALLVVWALRELLRGRTGPLAWSTALWYAHGLFRDYNLPTTHE